jgi:uncharacterized membrane protein
VDRNLKEIAMSKLLTIFAVSIACLASNVALADRNIGRGGGHQAKQVHAKSGRVQASHNQTITRTTQNRKTNVDYRPTKTTQHRNVDVQNINYEPPKRQVKVDRTTKNANVNVNKNVNKNVNANIDVNRNSNRRYYHDNGRYYYYDDYHRRHYDGWVAGYTTGMITMAMINANRSSYMTCYAYINDTVYQGYFQQGTPCYVNYPVGGTTMISVTHYSVH